jgi:hypothetical protein
MKSHTVRLDNRIVVYKLCLMAVNKLAYVTAQVVRFTVQFIKFIRQP